MSRQPLLDTDRLVRALPHLTLLALTATLLCLAEWRSKLFQQLMQEDGWAEWATVLAFGAAGVRALRGVRLQSQLLARVALVGLGAFSLFVAGEEISWGQRLFGYRPPELFLEHNFQQEANLHNLLKGILDTRFMVLIIALSYGVLAPFLSYVSRFPRQLAAPLQLMPYFLLVAWLELSYPYELVGEFAELLLGLLFLADVSSRRSEDERVAASWSSAGQALTVACGALLVPVNDAVLQLHSQELAQAAQLELEHMADALSQGEGSASGLFKKGHIHKRVYTAARAGYLTLPPDEFALDPWHSPYWLAFKRSQPGQGTLLVYSFGPNRRRDSDVDALGDGTFQLRGDDLGVWLPVEDARRAKR